ncbi:hypothetical protein B0H13DRAFT_2343847 [Mycena leptocephala]|nr:hypothetical protein B0H13DRAFT_2343847 [Mycena leptocephala]
METGTGNDGDFPLMIASSMVIRCTLEAVPRLGERAYEINSEGRSWELDDGPMGAVCELLLDVAFKEKIALTSIASVKKTADFPYAFDDGSSFTDIIQSNLIQLIQQHDNKVQRVCHLCGDRPTNWRAYISTHILRFIRRMKEALHVPVGMSLRCGFCARSNLPECEVRICKKGKTTHVEASCTMVSAFKYKPAEQGSKSTLAATFQLSHLSTAHPEYSSPLSPGGTRLPPDVWESMKVDTTEELALDIPQASIPAVFVDVAGPDEGLDRSNVVGKKRPKKVAPGPNQRRQVGA